MLAQETAAIARRGWQVIEMNNEKKAILKKPGEKLLRVTVHPDGDRIGSVRLSGDFFIYPEETVFDIESCLVTLEPEPRAIIAAVEQVVHHRNIQMVGISPATIAEGVCMAMEEK